MSKGDIYNCENCKKEFIAKSVHHTRFCNRKCALAFHYEQTKKQRYKYCSICKKPLNGVQKLVCSEICKEKRREKYKFNYPEKLPPLDKSCRCGTELDSNNYCVKCKKEYLPTQKEIAQACKELRKREGMKLSTIPYDANGNLRRYYIQIVHETVVVKNE